MAHLTNGTVSYERRVKTGEYEHKHAAVTIHYALDVGDNADEFISLAGTLAAGHVFKILLAKPRDSAPEAVAVVSVPDPAPAHEIIVEEVIPPATNLKAAKRVAAKKAPMTAAQVVEAACVVVEEVVPTPEVPFSLMAAATPAAVTEVIEDFTADAPSLTDAELSQALSRVNAKLKDGPRIRTLIGEFVQSGQSFSMIPAVRRGEFVTRLEALA